MAFEEEEAFQQLIHKNPGIILDGIPEINPILCDNTPAIVSLGTEINIQGKFADNIFIDTNGILTIVECKLYGDSRIAREVYPQIVNYASGIKEKLKDNTDEDKYLDEFFNIVNNTENKNCQFETPEKLIEHFFDEEKMLKTKDKDKWKIQFKKYFKKNIEEEIFRLIIACAPRKEKINNDSNQKTGNNFDQNKIKNLIQIVNFTESKSSKYDLIIMDSRLKEKDDSKNPDGNINEGDMVSRIIWRNYDSLREVPLISKYKREELDENIFFEHIAKSTMSEYENDIRDMLIFSKEEGLVKHWGASSVSLKLPDPMGSNQKMTIFLMEDTGYFYTGWLASQLKNIGKSSDIACIMNDKIAKLFDDVHRKEDDALSRHISFKELSNKMDELREIIKQTVSEIRKID